MSAPTKRGPYDYVDRNSPIEKVTLGNATYVRMRDGSLRRLEPIRPYRGKSERRQVIKDRREDKLAQAAA